MICLSDCGHAAAAVCTPDAASLLSHSSRTWRLVTSLDPGKMEVDDSRSLDMRLWCGLRKDRLHGGSAVAAARAMLPHSRPARPGDDGWPRRLTQARWRLTVLGLGAGLLWCNLWKDRLHGNNAATASGTPDGTYDVRSGP